VAFTAAHAPLQPLPEHASSPACAAQAHPWRRAFCGLVSGLDEAVANLSAAAIEALVRPARSGAEGQGKGSDGEAGSVILVVSSDNGGPAWFGALNEPLRGGKTSPFEGGVRVPAFATDLTAMHAARSTLGGGGGMFSRWLGEPRTFHGLFHIADWLPTFLGWQATGRFCPPSTRTSHGRSNGGFDGGSDGGGAGREEPDEPVYEFDGIDLGAVLAGPPRPRPSSARSRDAASGAASVGLAVPRRTEVPPYIRPRSAGSFGRDGVAERCGAPVVFSRGHL